MTLRDVQAAIASEPTLTLEEVEYRLTLLIRRDKPSVGAIALWLRLHQSEALGVEGDPFAAFAAEGGR